VQVQPRNVEVYETASGHAPFDDWMRNLRDVIGRAAIDARLTLLRRGSLGNKYRDVGDGLIELKIDTGPGYRVYLADDGKNSLILCAGSKRTQARDIKAAKQFWKDYKTRE